MLVHAHNQQLQIQTTLIHVDKGNHPFRELTKSLASNSFYPTGSDDFRELVKKQDKDQVFYMSGSRHFTVSTRKLLNELGVAKDNIKK